MYSGNNAIVSNIKYNKYGNRTYIKYGNNARNEYTYNALSMQLSSLRSYDASGSAMQNISYSYDSLYNITAITCNANGLQYNYTYAYDTLNRLVASTCTVPSANTPNYNFGISYSPAGRILNYTLTGNKLEDGQTTAMNIRQNYYYANTNQPHTPTGISPQNLLLGTSYSWDANGNFKGTSGRRLLSIRNAYFNEENRLAALGDWPRNLLVTPFGITSSGYVSSYLYSADGERVWKFAGTATMTYSNGLLVNSDLEMDKTFYPTPHTTFTKQKFYKHYFIGSERISTSNGQFVAIAANTPPHVGFVNPSTTANSFIAGFNDQIAHALDSVGYSGNITIDTVFSCIYQQSAAKGIGPIQPPIVICATQYYYHYNHQGSVALLTDRCGNNAQHLQYLPYGGIFVDHRPGSYSSTYTFSAKEKDSESGYNYFGARYYSDNMMQWLSVDPLSDERPSLSPYNYCQNNPIGRVDTWGMLDDEWKINRKGEITWLNENKHYDVNGKEVDKLFNRRGESIDVSKKVLDQKQASGVQSYTFYDVNEAEKFYYFTAESSDVEWVFADVLQYNKNLGYVGTDYGEGSTKMANYYENYFGNDIQKLSHSHPTPGGPPSYNLTIPGVRGKVGDLEAAQKSPYNYQREVYDVPKRTIYGYSKQTSIPIGNETPKWDYVRRRY